MLQALVIASGGLLTRGAFAEALTLTPRQTEGPFYPDHLPLDQDNDLLRISDHTTNAVGIVTNIGGRILDKSGAPLQGALVELWQADNNGCYLHSRGGDHRDADFQGYGKFSTGADGAYRFRTIKAGLYTGRTRHHHFAVTLPGMTHRFTTQLYYAGEPGNAGDGVLRGIRDEAQRAAIIRDFKPLENSPEIATTWDIVMGWTPGEPEHDEDDHHQPPPPRGEGRPPGPPPPRPS